MNRGRHKKSKQHLIARILGTKIANRILECQKEQNVKPDLDVFLTSPSASSAANGFNWHLTKEGYSFWERQLVFVLKNSVLYKIWKNDRS